MNTITERMKRYAAHYPSDLEPDEHNIFTDLQATVQALEGARNSISKSLEMVKFWSAYADDYSQNKWNLDGDILELEQNIKTIDSVLGEKK